MTVAGGAGLDTGEGCSIDDAMPERSKGNTFKSKTVTRGIAPHEGSAVLRCRSGGQVGCFGERGK